MTELKESKIIAGKKYFLLNDVMDYLGITFHTFKKYRKQAGIIPIKLGHKLYMTEKDLIQLIKSRVDRKEHKAGIFRRR